MTDEVLSWTPPSYCRSRNSGAPPEDSLIPLYIYTSHYQQSTAEDRTLLRKELINQSSPSCLFQISLLRVFFSSLSSESSGVSLLKVCVFRWGVLVFHVT